MKVKYYRPLTHKLFLIFGLIVLNLLFVSCSSVPQKSTIITLLINGDYEKSKLLLNRFNNKYSELNSSEMCNYHYYNGCYYYLIKKHDHAEEEFNKCLELNPSYLQALYSRASLRKVHLLNYLGAIQDYEEIIEILKYLEDIKYFDEKSLIALYSIECMDELRIPKEFRKQKNQLNLTNHFNSIAMKPQMLRDYSYRNLIDCFYNNNEIEKAINYITNLFETQQDEMSLSDYHSYTRTLGKYYFELNEYQNAINSFNNCLEFDADNYEIYYKIGISYFFLDDYDSCVKELTTCLEIMRNIDFAKANKRAQASHSLFIQRVNLEAFDEHSNLLISVLLYRAKSYSKLEEFEKCIVDLNEVIAKNPNNANAYYYRGYNNNYLGNKESALKDFLKVLTINPKMNSVNYSVALIYDAKEEYTKAYEYYNKFINNETNKTAQKFIFSVRRLKKLQNR